MIYVDKNFPTGWSENEVQEIRLRSLAFRVFYDEVANSQEAFDRQTLLEYIDKLEQALTSQSLKYDLEKEKKK